MRDLLLTRLAAFVCAVLGAGLLLIVLLDLLPRGTLLSGAAWGEALGLFARGGEPWQRLGVTLPLVLLALVVSMLGLAFGLLAGNRRLDRLLGAIAILLTVVPPFWLGLLLALGVGGVLRWLPASGFVPWSDPAGALASMILPALALGLPQAGALATRTRALIGEPPAPGRREEGHPGRAKLTAALPGLLGGSFAALLIGAVLVEGVFYLPGLGRLILGAAEQHDLITLRGGLFVLLLVASLGALTASLLRVTLDPELRR